MTPSSPLREHAPVKVMLDELQLLQERIFQFFDWTLNVSS